MESECILLEQPAATTAFEVEDRQAIDDREEWTPLRAPKGTQPCEFLDFNAVQTKSILNARFQE